VLALAVGCAGCGKDGGSGEAARPATEKAAPGAAATAAPGPAEASGAAGASGAAAACRAAAFAAELALPEASGSVWVEASFGLPAHVVVVSDSGHHGAFAVVDGASGAVLASGRLPIDGSVSDDLEGFARSAGLYYALTSGGRIQTFRRKGAAAFERTGPAYALDGVSCDSPRRGNCGYDFEGLCLADPIPATGCAGFAASRRDGDLLCLVRGPDGRLAPDRSQVIRVALPMSLSDCHIAADGQALYAVTNALGGNALLRVAGWRRPAEARVTPVQGHATGFIESVAAGPGGAIYRFSDSGGPVSAMFLDSCPPAGSE
jgi:hypothetical protein